MLFDLKNGSARDLLFHASLNEARDQTLMLVHGMGGSHHSWDAVAPLLNAFHLLLPDMNAHAQSLHSTPWTMANVADSLAELIRAKAHGRKAIVCGFSGGGYAAVHLAANCPALVESLIVSGVYDLYPKRSLIPFAPYLDLVLLALPNFAIDYMCKRLAFTISDEEKQAMRQNLRGAPPLPPRRRSGLIY
jgi:pimeloyl-ACP methyl ester carboxylesterase